MIFDKLLAPVTSVVNTVLKRVLPPEKMGERERAKLESDLTVALIKADWSIVEKQAEIIVAEAKGGSALQRLWRPITMLTFVALIVSKWMGLSAPGITESIELEILNIIKIGLGGYVVGRSVEKGIRTWKEK